MTWILTGPRFRSPVTINLCSTKLIVFADVVVNVRFTSKGRKICYNVCNQYKAIIAVHGPVDVDFMRGYCDFTGVTDNLNINSDLSSTCTCGYKIRCNHRTKMLTYSFRPNSEGYLRVSVAEFSAAKDITWTRSCSFFSEFIKFFSLAKPKI